jgi:hypothetical protein
MTVGLGGRHWWRAGARLVERWAVGMARQLRAHERQAVLLERGRDSTAAVVLAMIGIYDARRLACPGEHPDYGAAAWAQTDAMFPVAQLVLDRPGSRQRGPLAVQAPAVVIVLGQLAQNE